MEETIGGIQRVDHILTDPPYLYIKTHSFDKPWDERLFFENAKRLLPAHGFIALFGRGTSFYHWNTQLAGLGFVFKEEIVWDKRICSSPVQAVSRVHETLSIHTKNNGKIRKVTVPYIEQKEHDVAGLRNDIKRILSATKSEAGLNNITEFLNNGTVNCGHKYGRYNITNTSGLSCLDPAVGMLRSINVGMREKTIMTIFPCHYGNVHPTEKPVRLAERILALISDPGDTIYDPFMGSGSFGVACIQTGRKYIGSEMNPEYFDIAVRRISDALAQQSLPFEPVPAV
jgi:site-specific DNA-methyltransferase (adenine-specific)